MPSPLAQGDDVVGLELIVDPNDLRRQWAPRGIGARAPIETMSPLGPDLRFRADDPRDRPSC